MFGRYLRYAGGTMVATATAGAGYGYYWATTNLGEDSLERLQKYCRVSVPAIMEYKMEEARCEKLPALFPSIFAAVPEEEQKQRFQKLHDKWVQPLYNCFMELGGFYYKSGQKIASNFAQAFPKTYSDAFQPFLNRIPPRSPEQIRKIVEGELGCRREEVFSEWEDEPLGCASIGQTHRAVLRSTGKRVVVKVQNPEAERTFRGDVLSIKIVVDAFQPQFSVAFDEIAKQFATEFDYRGECDNALEIKKNLEKAGFTDIIVPLVYKELTTQKLLVMEEVTPSTPLHDALDAQATAFAKKEGLTKDEYIEKEKQKLDDEERALAVEGKTIEAASADDYNKYIALQRTKRFLKRAPKHMYNWTLGWILPNFDMNTQSDDVIVPLNAAQLVDDLLEVHGHEILIDGCFNADPHPGNILCADGKLALIDYGQVKRLSESDRLWTAKSILMVAAAIKVDPRSNPNVNPIVHQRARDSVVALAHEMGMKTKYNNPDVIYQLITVYMGRMDRAWVFPRNIVQWTDHMQELDPLEEIDEVDFFVMVNMASMMLRGLGHMLRQPRNVADVWEPIAKRALQEAGQFEEIQAVIDSWTDGIDSE